MPNNIYVVILITTKYAAAMGFGELNGNLKIKKSIKKTLKIAKVLPLISI